MAFAALLLWLWAAVPLATGARTLYLRDVFSTHLPAKAFGAEQLRHGSVPAFDPTWGLGMPFRGNPNNLPLYPGNLLYLVLPLWSAFNLHYALHWLLAALGMALLARELGQSRGAALVAALTYAGSGWLLSLLSFANILAVAAWWPFVLAFAARGGRRGVALAGIACGLALLGGEPITTALALGPLLLVAWSRHGLKKGLLSSFAIGLLGLVIALPQIVASARVVSFSTRVAIGSPNDAGRFHLGGARFLELLSPFPFGLPWDLGKDAYWSWDGQLGLPYIFSIYFGIVGLWLAALALRRHKLFAFAAVLGLLLAWTGGMSGDLLVRLSSGIARYPEKFLLWPALALPLLAGWGFERAVSERLWRSAAIGAALLAAGAAAVVAAAHPLSAWLAEGRVQPDYVDQAPSARIVAWTLALLLAAALLAFAAFAARRRWRAGVAFAQLLSLLPLAGLVATAPVSAFRPSDWADRFPPGTLLATSGITGQMRSGASLGNEELLRYVDLARLRAFDLGPTAGAQRGWGYPLAADLVGLHSPLTDLVLLNLESLSHQAVGNWLRVYGVSAVVSDSVLGAPTVRAVATRKRFGGTSVLYLVRDPAPAVWWPHSVTPAGDPIAALRAVGRSADPVADLIVSRPVEHHPGARVRLLRSTPERIEVEVSGEGGVLALRRTYQPLYRAFAAGRELRTLPVSLSLLGVEVPPGTHRVRIEVSSLPEKLAGLAALLAVAAALFVAWRSPREVGSLAPSMRPSPPVQP